MEDFKIRFTLFWFERLKTTSASFSKCQAKNISGGVFVEHPAFGGIHFGFESVSIFDYKAEKSIWDNCGTVNFDGKATLGQGVRIANKGKLSFKDGSGISANTSIICYKSISFGKDSLISWNCKFMDTDFHKVFDMWNQRTNQDREIVVGDHVWIGSESLILKGTQIAKDNVVAANSILSGTKINENNVIVGSFGKVLKRNVTWEP